MNTNVTIAVIVGALLLGGCAGTTRIVTDTATGGLGAFVGNKIGHGSPVGSVIGAGAGVLLGEAFTYANDVKAKTAYGEGFEKGRSDAVKQQYWLMVNQQRPGEGFEPGGNISLYDIPLPESRTDGVIQKPLTRVLAIEE